MTEVQRFHQRVMESLPAVFHACEPLPLDRAREQAQPEWKTHLCWFSCGGRCVNRSLVDDGVVLRQSSDDTHPDSPDYPQQRGCARGRNMRHAVFASERLKYPLVRRHWKPGGVDHHPELRGKDEWLRISWDEALDLAAQELARIKEQHGNASILCTGYENRTVLDRMYYAPSLNAFGGCTNTWGQASQGAFPLVSNMMKGSFNLGRMDYSDRFAIRHADLVVMWGQNPAWSMLGNVTYDYLQAKKAGARFVFVDPFCNPSMQPLADQWIPVRPGTDTALLLAIAWCLIDEDLHDQEFLDRCCVGFDAAHMPPDAFEGQQNFRDYVLGVYDGIPKTPQWAEPICGTPASQIWDLARQMGNAERVTLRASQAPARTENGAAFVQAFYTIGWMVGAAGRPGAETSAGAGGYVGFGGPPLVAPGPKDVEFPVNPICEPPRGGGSIAAGKYDPAKNYGIGMPEMWDAVLRGSYTDFAHGQHELDVRAIFKVGEGGRMNQNPSFLKAQEAFRKVDFALTSDIWMTNDCLYADIVLPSTSFWETDGVVQPKTNREFILHSSKICEPLFECREDLATEAELAKRWGIDPAVVNPKPIAQIAAYELHGAQVRNPRTLEMEPLIKLDQADLDRLGLHDGEEPHDGLISLEEFERTGVYQVEREPDDAFMHCRYQDFVRDPDGHPVPTRSGKFEISCRSIVEQYELLGLSPVAEVAHYEPVNEGYEATFSDWDAKAKGRWPLQTISLHHPSHAHQAYDSVATLGELFPNDLMVNPLDAREAGVVSGQQVQVESPHGSVVRRAQVTALIMPGVVALGEGSWARIDDEGIDRAGNTNTIQASALEGEGQCTWNSNRACIRPWDAPQGGAAQADTAKAACASGDSAADDVAFKGGAACEGACVGEGGR